jgi:hypothetical protein
MQMPTVGHQAFPFKFYPLPGGSRVSLMSWICAKKGRSKRKAMAWARVERAPPLYIIKHGYLMQMPTVGHQAFPFKFYPGESRVSLLG